MELLCVGQKWRNRKEKPIAVADTNKHACLY